MTKEDDMRLKDYPKEALDMLKDNRGDEDEQLDSDIVCEDKSEQKFAEDAVG